MFPRRYSENWKTLIGINTRVSYSLPPRLRGCDGRGEGRSFALTGPARGGGRRSG